MTSNRDLARIRDRARRQILAAYDVPPRFLGRRARAAGRRRVATQMRRVRRRCRDWPETDVAVVGDWPEFLDRLWAGMMKGEPITLPRQAASGAPFTFVGFTRETQHAKGVLRDVYIPAD